MHSNPQPKKIDKQETDKYLQDITNQYLASLHSYPTELKLKSIEIFLKLIDDIIKHPYIDKYRILNLSSESLPMTFRQPFCLDFLRRVGFIEDFSDNQQLLCYCYNSTIPTLLTVQKALKEDRQGLASEEFSGERVDILQMNNFENFLRYRLIIMQDLLKKEARQERVALQLSLDEMRQFCAQSGLRSLQEILINYYRDPAMIDRTLKGIVYSRRKADALVLSLKDFWVEAEFIRTTAFYIYQCFSDRISKSHISDPMDPNSRFARSILSLSLTQAQTLVRITEAKISSLRGIIIEFMNWYCLADDDPDRDRFSGIIEELSMGRERTQIFFDNLEIIISEKVAQQMQGNSTRLRPEEYKSWVTTPPSFNELPETNPLVDFSRDITKWFQPGTIDTYFAITYSTQMITTQLGFKAKYDKNKLEAYLAGAKLNPTDFFSKGEAGEALQSRVIGQNYHLKDVARTLYKNTSPASVFAAILNKHLDLLKEFLRNESHLYVRDHKRRTLLHYAAFSGSIDIAELLLQKKMNVDETDDLGKTPFDIAFEGNFYEGNISVCSMLIKHGVNPPLKTWEVLIDYALTSDNVTYLDLALKYDVPFVPSFHASLLRTPIKHQNIKVLRFIGDRLDRDTMKKYAMIRDQEDKNALDYALDTKNEEVIILVERLIGNESITAFPTIMKNQESFMKSNQDTLDYNIRFIKEREYRRKLKSQIQGEAGTQLPNTLTLLANNPDESDFMSSSAGKRNSLPRANYNVSDFTNSYKGTTNTAYLPPIRRPSPDQSFRHSSPLRKPSSDFKSLRNQSPGPRGSVGSGLDPSGYPLKYPPEHELQTADLNEGIETLLATLKKRREDEQHRLRMQKENGCHVS